MVTLSRNNYSMGGIVDAAAVLLPLLSSPFLSLSVSGLDGGFQSGPSPGSFYAGGMTYDLATNTVYTTGSHYNIDLHDHDGSTNDLMQGTGLDIASNCFVSKLDMSRIANSDSFNSLTDWSSYGNPGVTETCTTVATGEGQTFVVGSAEKGGLLHDDNNYPLLGVTAILDADTLSFISGSSSQSVSYTGDTEDNTIQTKLLYPVSAVHESGNKFDFLYVAALTSTDKELNPNNPPVDGNEINWQETQKFGKSFYLTVYKVKSNKSNKSPPELLWMIDFPIDMASDGTVPPVFAGGMILQEDSKGTRHLLVSGSTRGTGRGYGPADPNTIDQDGFVMQLDPKDGSFLMHKRQQSKKKDLVGLNNLREGTGADDFIRGMCHRKTPGSDKFYVVGGTKGDMTTSDQGEQDTDGNAGFQFGAGVENKYKDKWVRDESIMPFLRQVSFERNLGPIWTTQWAAMPNMENSRKSSLPSSAYAMDCVVDESSNVIYVVGTVLKGAMMTQGDVEMINQGGDDVWLAKVDETTGNVYWLTQLGSFANENVARHGSIAFDGENVIIYGNTGGNLYRQRSGTEIKGGEGKSDIFIMTVNGKTGAVTDNFYLGGTSSATVAGTVVGAPDSVVVPGGDQDYKTNHDPVLDDNDSVAPPTAPPTAAPKPPKKESPPPPEKESTDMSSSTPKKNKVGIAFAVIFGIVAVLVLLLLFSSRRLKKKSAESQKSSIFACLQKFDVEDIDLRRSPPGGWHGTYMNKLAYGVNKADSGYHDQEVGGLPESATYEDAPLHSAGGSGTHSSVASDSLFIDNATSVPTLGGGGYTDNADAYEEDEVDIRLNGRDFT